MPDKPAAAERGEYRYEAFGSLVIHRAAEDGSRVLTLFGELRVENAADLERELERIELDGAEEILVDLSGLQFIDSMGLRALLHADVRARTSSSTFALLRAPRHVHRVFEITGLDRRLAFAD